MSVVLYSHTSHLDVAFARLAQTLGTCRWVRSDIGDVVKVRQYLNGREAAWQTVKTVQECLDGNLLVLWNGGFDYCRPIVETARKRGMRMCYIEHGLFPGTWQMDPWGVNARSTVCGHAASEVRGLPVAPSIWTTAFPQRQIHALDRKSQLSGDIHDLPDRYLFVPLQLEWDTQIRDHSPYLTMGALLTDVQAALPPGMALVVKEHPTDTDSAACARRREEFPDVTWCRTRPTAELIAGAAAVVVINSSVGLQALCARKPVVTLGASVYGRAGVTYPTLAETVADLSATVRRALAEGVAPLTGAWLTYLRDCWSVPYTPAAQAARVREMLAGQAPWLEVLG